MSWSINSIDVLSIKNLAGDKDTNLHARSVTSRSLISNLESRISNQSSLLMRDPVFRMMSAN